MPEDDTSNSMEASAHTPAAKGFAVSEMIRCDACRRANPPTRGTCLYCGAVLSSAHLPEATTGEARRPADASGNDYCIVAPAGELLALPNLALTQLASLVGVSATDLQAAAKAASSIVLAAPKTRPQADAIVDQMRALDISPEVIDLSPSAASIKIRALEFTEDSIIGLPQASAERSSTRWADVILIVSGRVITSRHEVEERRRRGRMQPIDTRDLSSDESVIDLYSNSGDSGWRISVNNFDFSCLGEQKRVTAFENARVLLDSLAKRALNARVDESYSRVRPLLANIWPAEKNTRKGEWRRSGAGKFDVSTITTTDNERQFNNYSRLLYCIERRG